MSFYRIDAEYNPKNPVLSGDETPDFPSRLQIATKSAFAEIRLSRSDYEAVLHTVATAIDEDVPNKTELENGQFALKAAPPNSDETWELDIEREWNRFRCTFADDEASNLIDLLRMVHPDHEIDVEDNPHLEAGSA